MFYTASTAHTNGLLVSIIRDCRIRHSNSFNQIDKQKSIPKLTVLGYGVKLPHDSLL